MAISGYGNVSYPGGTMRTESGITAGSQAGGLAGLDPGGLLEGAFSMRERAKESDMLRRLREEQMRWQQEKQWNNRPQLSGRDPYEDAMKDLAMRERVAEVNAKQAAPKKLMTGFNIMPGWITDTDSMNAYQRQAYLPQNAQTTGGFGSAGGDEGFEKFRRRTSPTQREAESDLFSARG